MSSRSNRYLIFLSLLVLIQAGFFVFYGYTRHTNYLTSIIDLGQFDQAIWGFLNGHPFLNTVLFNAESSWLGGHFNLILLLFVPFYAIVPSVNWLIIAQSLALSFTAIPLFFLSRKMFNSDAVACLWAIAYLFNPFVLNAAAWDFHAVTLAVPFIALAFYALECKNFRLLCCCCLIVLICKEHFGLLLVGFGLLWAIKYREARPALILVLLGSGCFVLIVGVLMPFFNPSGDLLMVSTGEGQLSRYKWLGDSAGEVFLHILNNPVEVVRTILFSMNGWIYLFLLALPLLFLPLLEFWALLPGIADFMVNLLSSNATPRSVYSYHSATLIPVVMAAAIYGLRRAGRRLTLVVTVAVLLVSMVMGCFLSTFYPLPGGFFSWDLRQNTPLNDLVIHRVQERVGPRSVSVQSNIGAHFSQRMELYRFPNRVGDAEMIVLNLESPTWRIEGHNPVYVGTLAHHLQMDPRVYLSSIEDLLSDERYGVVLWDAPWLVLEKDVAHNQDVKPIEAHVQKLIVDWQ
jgi:uncharacterized membrane protein